MNTTKKQFQYNLALRGVKLLNIILVTIPFTVCWMVYYSLEIYNPFYGIGNWLLVMLFALMYAGYGRIYDAFLISINRISEIVYSQGLAAAIASAFSYIVILILTRKLPNPVPLLGALVVEMMLVIGWAYFAHKWYFRSFAPKRSAVIYDKKSEMEELIHEYGLEKKFKILETGNVDACIKEGLNILDEKEVVFLCDIHSHERNIILKQCVSRGVDAYVIPRIGDILMSGARRMNLFHLPILYVERYNPVPEYMFLKRVFDIFASGIALLIFAPIMLVTAAIIKLTDKGPVFYKQRRLTQNGQEFSILKFRSMRVDAEKDGVARLSTGDNDNRITPVGQVIRKLRIDELPQLVNILKGDMTIVGPRPERPEIAALYEKKLPEFALRLQAKAGLTGLAQVYGRYNTTPYNKLQMDLMYIANPSFLEDLRIMFATVKILFKAESTEGIQKGMITPIIHLDGSNEVAEYNERKIKSS